MSGAGSDCRDCGHSNPGDASRCQRCGVELSAGLQAEKLLGRTVGSYLLEDVRSQTARGMAYGATEEGSGRWVEVEVFPLDLQVACGPPSPVGVGSTRSREFPCAQLHPSARS